MTGKKTRMTMELSEDLLTEVDAYVLEGKVESRDDFFEKAALAELAALRRIAIDAEISLMATDLDYQEEAIRIAQEFAVADWGALSRESLRKLERAIAVTLDLPGQDSL